MAYRDKYRDPEALEDYYRQKQEEWEARTRQADTDEEREQAEQEAASYEREAESMGRVKDNQRASKQHSS